MFYNLKDRKCIVRATAVNLVNDKYQSFAVF